jgi:hypothetical protein
MKQLALAVGAAVIMGMTYQALSLSAPERVMVCHVEGNGSAHVIEISERAVEAHLAHGDSLEAAEGLEPGDSCEVTDGVEKWLFRDPFSTGLDPESSPAPRFLIFIS